MGAFTGLRDAKRGFSSNFLKQGKYVVRIDSLDFFDSDNGEFWKNTLTVLAVEEGEHKVGEVVHVMFKYVSTAEGKQIFQRNLKAFLAGVLDVEDDRIDEAAADRAKSEDSPLKGLVTVVTARNRASKDKVYDKGPNKGQPVEYTVYSWEPSLDDEAIKEAIGKEAYEKHFPNG